MKNNLSSERVTPMTLSHQDLVEIVEKSSTLTERLSSDFKSDVGTTETKLIQSRLEQWCQSTAQGQWTNFENRLEWDSLSLETIRSCLGPVHLANSVQLPTWTQTLKQVSHISRDLSLENHEQNPFNPNHPLPFEEILLPFLVVARKTLDDRLRNHPISHHSIPRQVLSDSASLALEWQLLSQLVNISSQTLHQEFANSRPVGSNLLNLVIANTSPQPERVYYDAFVKTQRQDGLQSLFKTYPVLAKLMILQIDHWVEATAEFIERLLHDLPEIYLFFNGSDGPPPEKYRVAGIKAGLSDAHHRGRSVIIVTLGTGRKVVYKPKALDLEIAYNKLLTWCNHQDTSLDFKVLEILNRQDYGWIEYAHHRPCHDQAAVQRFYKRSGQLLYLLAMLGSTDCHHENLIADGEHLVLIDMEAIMQPIPNAMIESISQSKENEEAEHSPKNDRNLLSMAVLGTGLLPRWFFNHNGRIAYDISALGSTAGQQAYSEAPIWKFINTDKMHVAKERFFMPPKFNLPIVANQPAQVDQYIDDLAAGFRQMHSFCLKTQSQWLSETGPLSLLKEQRVRFIFRATRAYYTILNNSFLPDNLKDGINRSIEIERLGRAFLWTEHLPKTWPLFELERQSIEHLDIPYFDTSASTPQLRLKSSQPIDEYFKDSSYDKVRLRFRTLEAFDVEETIALIRGSFYARSAHHPKSNPEPTPLKESWTNIQSLSPAQLCQEAQAIAQKILDNAIPRQNSEDIYWLGYHYCFAANRFQMQGLNSSFYNGNFGIAVFLAALESATEGEHHYRTAVMQALSRSRKTLKAFIDDKSIHQGAFSNKISRISSVGTSLYGLVRISQFLKEQTLMDDALSVASLITPERIAVDLSFEVAEGVAGMLLGLLVLYQETGHESVLERACFCGHHLLKHQQITQNGNTWKLSTDQPRAGLAHGTLGIAYSLLRLYQITQESEFVDAAKGGFQYEKHFLSELNCDDRNESHTNHSGPSQQTLSRWDYWACGLEFAQIGDSSSLISNEIKNDIEDVVSKSQRVIIEEVDTLYCGNFSRIEFLLMAAKHLSQPKLQSMALQQATQRIHQAELSGGYQLFANLPCQVFNPNLFHGTAGIGYELLRLAYPETFPSILLWK